jgi:hypothetical protein
MALELTIDPHASIHAAGPVTIELPEYMRLLAPGELAEAKAADNRADLIFASGRHPNGDIVFITGDGFIREISWDFQVQEGMPQANVCVIPIDYGLTLKYLMTGSYEIAAGWAIEHSMSLLCLGALSKGPEDTRLQYVDQ